MVLCQSLDCPVGWYHLACLDPPLTEAPQGSWYCCDACRVSPSLIYCICKKKRGKEDSRMVQCVLGAECHHDEFYHLTCLGKKRQDIPGMNTLNDIYCFPFILHNDVPNHISKNLSVLMFCIQ